MHRILPGAVLLPSLLLGSLAFADSFGVSPYRYGYLVNEALKQVGSEVRLHRDSCTEPPSIECRYSLERIKVMVQGQVRPPLTSRIFIEADLMRDEAGANPIRIVADCVLTLGASMVVVDPQLPATRRAEMLSDLMTEALDTGRSEDEGVDARYTLAFDEAANGILNITVTPLNAITGNGLAELSIQEPRTAAHRRGSHP